MSKTIRDNPSSNGSSCYTRYWKFWRNFCCLFGWYPVLVAPIVTAGFLLSLYSSAGCDYVVVDIGFTPSNAAYNQSQALLGFFFYTNTDVVHDNAVQQTLHTSCERYSTDFEEDFINVDRTWKVARIMALIALSSSLVATILAWLMVMTPLPTNVFWPTVLLPLVMLSFIAEGSKFLIFDISACSGAVWLPSGVDSQPQTADSCLLGNSAILGVVAGSLFLISLMMVCLYTPDRRRLNPDYGQPSSTSTIASAHNHNDQDGNPEDGESSTEVGPFDDDQLHVSPEPLLDRYPGSNTMRDIESSDGDGRLLEDDVFTDGGESEARTRTAKKSVTYKDHPPSAMTEEAMSSHLQSTSVTGSGTKPDVMSEPVPEERISESRLSKVKELELLRASNYYSQQQNDVLSQLVSELDESLSVPLDVPAQQRFL